MAPRPRPLVDRASGPLRAHDQRRRGRPAARPLTPLNVQETIGPEDFEEAFAVRRTVFIEEQRVPEELERDEHDAHATHVVARAEGRVIGTGRLAIIEGLPRIGRMAVLKEHRGSGVGRALLVALLDAARRQGLQEVHLAAQVQVIGFYAKLGFTAYGEEFSEAGIRHRMMKLALP